MSSDRRLDLFFTFTLSSLENRIFVRIVESVVHGQL